MRNKERFENQCMIREADDRGELFQAIVANHLKEQGWEVQNKGCWGPDLVAKKTDLEFAIEVKGISAITRKDGQQARYQFQRTYIPDVDYFAFVLKDKRLNVKPAITFLRPEPVLAFLQEPKRQSDWIAVPIHKVGEWAANGYKMIL